MNGSPTREQLQSELIATRADLAEARAQLGRARAELRWLDKAGIDLHGIMEHRVTRAGRAVAGRLRRRPRPPAIALPAEAVANAPAVDETARRAGVTIPAGDRPHAYAEIARVLRDGATPGRASAPSGSSLDIALVVPPFGFGSGGHQVIFSLMRELEHRGHAVSCHISDPHHEQAASTVARLRRSIRQDYTTVSGPVVMGFDHWTGADVVIATGWQTVFPVLGLPDCGSRFYLVNDHEPEFYPTSVESLFAARTYTLGLPCIVGGGPWLADLLERRYGADVVARFAYPVAPAFTEQPVRRRDDTIVVYGRDSTPRRGVALAWLALEELKRRRPDLRIVAFGDEGMPQLSFAYEHLGRIAPEDLSLVYSEATVGVSFSLTHGSLVPHDMLACGLPPVDLDGYATAAEHRETGLVELAAPEPLAICAAIERLLDDPAERRRRAVAGRRYLDAHTWPAAVDRVEAAIRDGLAVARG